MTKNGKLVLPTITYAKTIVALVAATALWVCAPAKAHQPVVSDDQACERVMAVLAANTTYRAEQMAGCDGGVSDEFPGYYVLRVNAHCRDPQGCGSVLLGWYAVEAASGAVHDWDVGEWRIGARIDRDT